MVAAAAATMVRIEFKDASSAGPIPNSTFNSLDSVINAYASADVAILLLVDYMTFQEVPWGKTDNASWAPYVAELSRRAGQIAAHYSNIPGLALEVWNEEDLQATFVPPAIYAFMLASVRARVVAVAGGATSPPVIMGGLASGSPPYVAAVMAASSGGDLPADGLGLHPYGQRPSPSWPSPTWGFGVLGDLLIAYAAVAPAVPIWVTGECATELETVYDSDSSIHIQTGRVRHE